jgi:hypothetical protein
MEIVEQKRFYHIARSGSLTIESKLFIGKEKNNFNSYFDKFGCNYHSPITGDFINSSVIGHNMLDYIKTGNKNPELEKVFTYDKDGTIKHLTETIDHYLRFIRENIFEEVRNDYFPNYLSRYRCLWIIPDDNDAVKYWWERLGSKGNIYELSVSGKMHQASQQYLNLTTNSLDYIRKEAFKYWTGVSGRDKIEDECLFEGFVEVIALKTIKEFST